MPKTIYFDFAATTPVDKRVMNAMTPFFSKVFGNTMSFHSYGQEAKEHLEQSRQAVADLMGAESSEIVFTSSATESNNLALKGVALANKDKGKHIIISAIEHPCIRESAKWLKQQGFEIEEIRVDKYGLVDLKHLKQMIRKDTVLISVMYANNEIGTIEPIEQIGAICKKANVIFHTDASQSFGKVMIEVNKMNIDLLTASSHKMYGPKGVGCLFIRKGVRIEPILHGGGHEFSLRSSTVNLAGIVGFAKACQLCKKEMKKEEKRLTVLREKIISTVLKKIKAVYLNGHPEKRLANNINFSFAFIEGESLVVKLDTMGIAASTGSACSSDKLETSHVLKAICTDQLLINGSLRISLGRQTTKKNIDFLLKVLPKAVKELRDISPFSK